MSESLPAGSATRVFDGSRATALASIAFGGGGRASGLAVARHLALLSSDALELDLSDPAQRDFGAFELVEQIGQGGMGVVYRAREIALAREVALKLLTAGPWAADEFIQGFKREAQHTALLQHPNIVTVFGIGEHDGLHFYTMQLVRGASLAHRVQSTGPLAPREAAALMRRVADAVDYAHCLGVLHLDLKPGNVLIDADGEPKVADFGLARRLDQALAARNEQVSGTPSYMAPEQAQLDGEPLSRATDIYGCGAILYELLTGRPPFLGATPLDTLQRVVTQPLLPPRHWVPTIPRDLEAICLKCLAKSAQARYGQASELADDLRRFLDGHAVSVRPLSTLQRSARWARREPALAAMSFAALLALLVGLAATLQQWRRAESNAFTANLRLWEGRREAALQLEREGAGWDAVDRLLHNVAEQDAAGAVDQADADRRRLGLLLGQGAALIDMTAITDAAPLALAVSDDGSRIGLAFGDRSVRWYDATTLAELGRIDLGEQRSSGGQLRATTWLRFVGNERLLATQEWYRTQPDPTGGDTWLLDLRAKTVVEPPAAFADFSDAAFSDDGRVALLRDRSGDVQAWLVDPWQPLSPRRRPPAPSGGEALPWRLSPDGRYAVALVEDQRVVQVYATDGMTLLRTLAPTSRAKISAWSIDAKSTRLAIGDEQGRLRLLDLPDGTPRLLPSARGARTTWMAFDASGGWLAAGTQDGHVHAFDAISDDPLVSGSLKHEFRVRRVSLDRDRRLLVVAGDRGLALWRLPAGGGYTGAQPVRIGLAPAAHADAGTLSCDWSPATGLFASAGHDGQLRIWRLPEGPMSALSAPHQAPDGPSFAAAKFVDVQWDRLRVTVVDGSPLTPWKTLSQPPGYAEITPDGQTLLLTQGDRLHRLDAATLEARGEPLPLPASPQRFLLSPDGRQLLLGFTAPHAAGIGERLRLWNVAGWREEPGEALMPGPLLQLGFDSESRRVVAVGQGDTAVLTVPGLHPLGHWQRDDQPPVVAADFLSGDERLWLLVRDDDARPGSDAAVRWHPGNGAIDRHLPLAAARPFAVVALPDGGAFVAGEARLAVIDADGKARLQARVTAGNESPMGTLAANAERSLLALSTRQQVQLYAADGTPLGLSLPISAPRNDGIFDLAFSDDDAMLYARTVHGIARWPLALAARDDAPLAQRLAWLGGEARSPRRIHLPSAKQRAQLRADDPGTWQAPEARPAIAIAGHARDGMPIPQRMAGTPSTAIDLAPVYDLAPDSRNADTTAIKPFLRPWPAGLQHFRGVPFDVRGIAAVGPRGLGACLPMPTPAIASVQPLLLSALRTPEDGPRVLGELAYHYTDGGVARVPLRATIELAGYGSNDQDVPFAFVARAPRAAMGFRASAAAAPQIMNPEPQRPVRCIELRGTGEPMQLFAMTVADNTLVAPEVSLTP